MIRFFKLALFLASACVFADDIYPPLPPLSSVVISGTVSTSVTSSVLPTGAATETKQDTGNSSLSGIDSSANSIQSSTAAIDLNTDQVESKLDSILTELNSKTEPTDTQPVSGSLGRTWTLSSGTDSVSASVSNFPSLQNVNLTQILSSSPSATNFLPSRITNGTSYVDPTQIRALTSSDQITVANPTLAVTQSGAWTTGRTWGLTSGSDSVTADQGGAWTVTANAGTNLNTSALALAATQTDKSQYTRITDGTNDGVVKAGSSAALAADPSLVVALSPNSPLPTGSNTIGALTANQSVNVNQYGGVATTLGQKTMASSQPVTVASDQTDLPIKLSDGALLDAFGRLRVSNPDTLFDNNFRQSLQPLLWSESTATGGTVTHTPNSAAATLAVTTSNGSSAIYQTRRYFPYNAGKSHLVIFTGILGTGQANTRKRYGYFDANDGIFFEQSGTGLNVVRRTSTSGSVVDNSVAQASWNLDPLDGTGASGFTLDVTKANIFFIDFEWLGVGRIRMGVANPNGGFIFCHEFINANAHTVPYMRTGTLPIRAEITNTAGAASTASLAIICQTVISEGGAQSFGTVRAGSRGFTARTVSTSFTPIVSIRLKAANITAAAKFISASVFGSTADDLEVAVFLNPTLTGSTFAATGGETVELDTAATASTGGTQLSSAYFRAASGAANNAGVDLPSALNTWLGSNVAGTADIISVQVRVSTGTADVTGGVTWLEL